MFIWCKDAKLALVTYTHHLTPLFTLTNGTKAYPSSFTVGIDVFYFISRFTGHRE